ncbi:hypothetical protein EDB19DRAFT_2022039 [Suillus lakei]|nr:hypothetical protein EDB19DRAFT_2022039 [Suillus lakei]
MDWMLKTSTYPDAIRAVLDLLSVMPFRPNVDVKSLCENVLHMFKECFSLKDNPILEDALAYGTVLLNFSMKYPQAMNMLLDPTRGWNFWELWHTVYLSQAVEQCQNLHRKMMQDTSNLHHQADIRAAMHMVVPNAVGWIWDAEFKPEPDQKKAILFSNITAHFICTKDFDAAGDAFILFSGFKGRDHSPSDLIPFLKHNGKLLHGALHGARVAFNNPAIKCDLAFRNTVLRAICPENGRGSQFTNANKLLNFTEWPTDSRLAGSPLSVIQRMLLLVLPTPSLGNPAEYIPFCHTLMGYLRSNESKDSKRVALRRACRLRQDLATIDADGVDPLLRDMVLSELYPALLKVVHTDWFDCNDYLRLIFALASSPKWLPRLHKCITWCIGIIPELQKSPDPYSFYPAGIFLRIQPDPDQAVPELGAITKDQWWNMMRMAWHAAGSNDSLVLIDVIEVIEALVKGTEKYMPDDNEELQSLLGDLDHIHQLGDQKLRTGKKVEYEYAVEYLKGKIHGRLQALQPGPATV